MNKKNFFKTLAAAMLMPAMLLTVSCSSEDDLVNNTAENTETVVKKGYALPVTVSATRQSDGTRASFDGSKLEFSAGDKLFVNGWYGSSTYLYAGTLDYDAVSKKFSGTIYTQSEYPGTADALLTAADTRNATLLPAGYEGYGYLYIKDNDTEDKYDDQIDEVGTKPFALTKKVAVEQFSCERSYSYSSGFDLKPETAILNFTITGLTSGTPVNVKFRDYLDNVISENVTPDGDGTATFAIGIYAGSDLNDCTLTVAGNDITLVSESKEVEAGKIYNISRSAAAASGITSPSLGQVIGSDGKNYDAGSLPSGVDAVAMIAYVSGSHGLAIALSNEMSKDEDAMDWTTATTTAAAHTPAFAGCTWRLPSKDDWENMFYVNSGYSGLNDKLRTAGGDSSMLQEMTNYWSSTEKNGYEAYYMNFESYFGANYYIADKTSWRYVRAVLAF